MSDLLVCRSYSGPTCECESAPSKRGIADRYVRRLTRLQTLNLLLFHQIMVCGCQSTPSIQFQSDYAGTGCRSLSDLHFAPLVSPIRRTREQIKPGPSYWLPRRMKEEIQPRKPSPIFWLARLLNRSDDLDPIFNVAGILRHSWQIGSLSGLVFSSTLFIRNIWVWEGF